MNTPDTEWENEFDERFGDTFRLCCDDETLSPVIKGHIRTLLSSRDTYWKERVESGECLCEDKGVIELVEAERSEIRNAFVQVVKGQPASLFILPNEVTKVVGYVSVPELGEVAYKGQEIDLMALVNETLALTPTPITNEDNLK